MIARGASCESYQLRRNKKSYDISASGLRPQTILEVSASLYAKNSLDYGAIAWKTTGSSADWRMIA